MDKWANWKTIDIEQSDIQQSLWTGSIIGNLVSRHLGKGLVQLLRNRLVKISFNSDGDDRDYDLDDYGYDAAHVFQLSEIYNNNFIDYTFSDKTVLQKL